MDKELKKKTMYAHLTYTILTGLEFLLILIIMPIVFYWIGYFWGIIIQFTVGSNVIETINLLFGENRFSTFDLPKLCGLLGSIRMLFWSFSTKSKQVTKR